MNDKCDRCGGGIIEGDFLPRDPREAAGLKLCASCSHRLLAFLTKANVPRQYVAKSLDGKLWMIGYYVRTAEGYAPTPQRIREEQMKDIRTFYNGNEPEKNEGYFKSFTIKEPGKEPRDMSFRHYIVKSVSLSENTPFMTIQVEIDPGTLREA